MKIIRNPLGLHCVVKVQTSFSDTADDIYNNHCILELRAEYTVRRNNVSKFYSWSTVAGSVAGNMLFLISWLPLSIDAKRQDWDEKHGNVPSGQVLQVRQIGGARRNENRVDLYTWVWSLTVSKSFYDCVRKSLSLSPTASARQQHWDSAHFKICL
jgi:hypothetical protein